MSVVAFFIEVNEESLAIPGMEAAASPATSPAEALLSTEKRAVWKQRLKKEKRTRSSRSERVVELKLFRRCLKESSGNLWLVVTLATVSMRAPGPTGLTTRQPDPSPDLSKTGSSRQIKGVRKPTLRTRSRP